jgi:hypothetical protein
MADAVADVRDDAGDHGDQDDDADAPQEARDIVHQTIAAR